MRWAVLLLAFLILFGPWFVWLAERKQIRWLRPVSYFCLFLGPALVVLGIINHLKRSEGAVMKLQAYPTQKNPAQTPSP
jgi:hypothetical protein